MSSTLEAVNDGKRRRAALIPLFVLPCGLLALSHSRITLFTLLAVILAIYALVAHVARLGLAVRVAFLVGALGATATALFLRFG